MPSKASKNPEPETVAEQAPQSEAAVAAPSAASSPPSPDVAAQPPIYTHTIRIHGCIVKHSEDAKAASAADLNDRTAADFAWDGHVDNPTATLQAVQWAKEKWKAREAAAEVLAKRQRQEAIAKAREGGKQGSEAA